MSNKDKLIEFILNLTDEEVKKIMEHYDELVSVLEEQKK